MQDIYISLLLRFKFDENKGAEFPFISNFD